VFSDVQALGEQRQMTTWTTAFPHSFAERRRLYPPQMQNVEIVDGRNLPLFLNTDLQNSKSRKSLKIMYTFGEQSQELADSIPSPLTPHFFQLFKVRLHCTKGLAKQEQSSA
jgi:hypothetical protein